MSVSISPQAKIAAYRALKRKSIRDSARSRYEHDPVAWIEQRAKGYMYDKLKAVARSVHENRRTAVPSAHDVGKSWLSARLACWWLDSSAPGEAFVVTTAPSAKQVKAVLWKEMRRVFTTAKLPGRMNQTEYWVNNELVAMGRKPNDYDPTAFQGIHARKVLLIMDEATGIPQDIYIAGNSLIANEFGRILAIGNPDDPGTYFFTVCQPDSGWSVISISAFDTPNFTGEDAPQAVKDVLVNKIYVEEMLRDVGEDSGVYTSKVLGKFPENTIDGIIPLSWIKQCMNEDAIEEYEEEDLLPVELGVDVGAGGDETSIRERRGILVGRCWEAKTPKAVEAYAIVMQALIETGATRVKIDVIGIGWGLIGMLETTIIGSRRARRSNTLYYDEILEMEVDISNVEVVAVNVGQSSTDPMRFPKLRDQIWWQVGRELSQDKGWNLTGLDDITVTQLTDPIKLPDIANRNKVESKQDTMRRTKKASPNRADALLLAYCDPPTGEQEAVAVYYDPVQIGVNY